MLSSTQLRRLPGRCTTIESSSSSSSSSSSNSIVFRIGRRYLPWVCLIREFREAPMVQSSSFILIQIHRHPHPHPHPDPDPHPHPHPHHQSRRPFPAHASQVQKPCPWQVRHRFVLSPPTAWTPCVVDPLQTGHTILPCPRHFRHVALVRSLMCSNDAAFLSSLSTRPSLFFFSIVCPAPPLDAAASTMRVLVAFRSEGREPSFFVLLKHPTSRALELVGATRHVAAMIERAAPRAASNDSPRY